MNNTNKTILLNSYEIIINEGRLYLLFDLTKDEEITLEEETQAIDVFTYETNTLGLTMMNGDSHYLVFSDFPSELLMDSPLVVFSCITETGEVGLNATAIDVLDSTKLTEKINDIMKK